jgi:hypothetical protein
MSVDRMAVKHEYLRQLIDYRLDCGGSAQLGTGRIDVPFEDAADHCAVRVGLPRRI